MGLKINDMKRLIKFRAWVKNLNEMIDVVKIDFDGCGGFELSGYDYDDLDCLEVELMQFTGLYDRTGKEIYEGDVLRFADKWEWYKTSYGIKMHFAHGERFAELQKQYDAEPFEERVISLPDSYSWLLDNDEISRYWEVVGNRFENPELLK